MVALELRFFLSTVVPELLLSVWGLQNPNFSDMTGFFDLPV